MTDRPPIGSRGGPTTQISIAAGISGGLASAGPLAGKGWELAAARGAVSNAMTQGIGVATGMQERFDWTGVAVAGVVSGVGYAVGGALNGAFGDSWAGEMAAEGLANLAGGTAGAAARSLITGADFGDNFMAVLPDVIAATVGNAIARGVTQRERITPIDEDKLISAEGPVEAMVFDQNPELLQVGEYSDHAEIMGLQRPYATPRRAGDGLGTVTPLSRDQYVSLDEARTGALVEIDARLAQLEAYLWSPTRNAQFQTQWKRAFGNTPMSAENLRIAKEQLVSMRDHIMDPGTMYMFNNSDDYLGTARYIPDGEGPYGGRPLITLYRGFFSDSKSGAAPAVANRIQYLEHELAHLKFGVVDKVARVGDYAGLPAYGRERAASLARLEPLRAFNNAENWAKFVSNRALPAWGGAARTWRSR